jgi:Flp pilus assembly protein TadD
LETVPSRPEVTHLKRLGEKFFANLATPDGERRDFEIKYTFGVEPLQQYLVETTGGRLQALTVAWDTRQRRWFELYPDDERKPGDATHWSGVYLNWNAMCAECHSTNLRTRYDPETDTYNTTFDEIDVGCQACHGPGAQHLRWARGMQPSSGRKGLVVDYAAMDNRGLLEQCARCHSRRERVTANDAHGRAFLDDFSPATLRPGLYHADGQIDDEVYVYGSFVQSRMYAAGVGCNDCHDSHSLGLKREGDALCTACHQPKPDPRFPSLTARRYDSEAHHFHPPESEGARCVSCHMPGKLYMTADYRRDHSFRIPRPDLSARTGAPDACTQCHNDKAPAWAKQALVAKGRLADGEPHYGEALADARAGKRSAPAKLIAVIERPATPDIVRATALEHLGQYGNAGAAQLARGLSPPAPIVRIGALRALERLPDRVRAAGAFRLIADPVRAVRVEAARLLAGMTTGDLDDGTKERLERAMNEYREALSARSDLPGGQFALAREAELRGDTAGAIGAYRKSLQMDRRFLPARFNLATLLNQQGQLEEAEAILREGLALEPAEGELHYSLALLLAEHARLRDAVTHLAEAAKRLPRRARVHYNYALALQQTGREEKGFSTLKKAARLDPGDADIIYALTLAFEKRKAWEQAERYARRLMALRPDWSVARQLVARYEALRRLSK